MKRPTGTKWRQKAFAAIVARDGEHCSECKAAGRTIWRQMGTWAGERWGEDVREYYRYTKVHPTSNLEVDHRQPLSEGGDNDLPNLWLLCTDCHKRKTSAERSARLKKLFADARIAA